MIATRLITFALGALVSLDAAYWVLHWPQAASTAGATVQATAARPASASAISRVLGGSPDNGSGAKNDTRFRLLGVLARAGLQGAAVISVDGKPARAYRSGGRVVEGWILQDVSARQAVLAPEAGHEGSTLTLDLPQHAARSGSMTVPTSTSGPSGASAASPVAGTLPGRPDATSAGIRPHQNGVRALPTRPASGD